MANATLQQAAFQRKNSDISVEELWERETPPELAYLWAGARRGLENTNLALTAALTLIALFGLHFLGVW